MTPKEKAEELYKKAGSFNKHSFGLNKGSFSPQKAVDIALITVDEVLGVLRYFIEENAYREDITKTYWQKVKNELIKIAKRSN